VSVAEFRPHGQPDGRGSDEWSGSGADRLPPQDNDAEQCVLGAMLLSKDAIADVVEVVRGTDFYRPVHETLYDAVVDLYGRGEPADAVTVSAELQRRGELARVGGAPYVHTLLAGVPIAANAGYYAEIVREKAILRRLVDAGTKVAQLGYAGEGRVDDVVDRAQAEVYAVTEKRSSEDYLPLSEIIPGTLEEIEAIEGRDGTMTGVPTGIADLDGLTNGLHPGQMVIVAARPAVGKALSLDTALVTPTGWTTMGEVRVGDLLVGDDGRPTRVVAATEPMTARPCYEVHFSDGTWIVADAQHQWLTETRAARRSRCEAAATWSRTRVQPQTASVVTTQQIAATVRCETDDDRLNHAVLTTAPLDLPDADLPVAPYTLGVWLGDGHCAAARFTSADPEVALFVEADGYRVTPGTGLTFGIGLPRCGEPERACAACGRLFVPHTRQVRTCGRTCGGAWRARGGVSVPATCVDCGAPTAGGGARCKGCVANGGPVTALLRGLGVLGDKHVPRQYLRASCAQRRALLAGLLDTDGTVTHGGSVQVALGNAALARGVYELVVGLGYRCGWKTERVRGRSEDTSTSHRLTFSATDEVFRLGRKLETHRVRRPADTTRVGRRYITEVRRIESVPVRCVQVDNDSRLYLAGPAMVPTHNSTLALDICRSASLRHGMTSAIFSLEMSRSEITMRLLSAEARIPLHHMRNGTMNEDDWSRLARRMSEINDKPLFIDDSPNMTMMEIRAKARRLKQRHDLRLVVVDYLQLMTSGRRVESRQLEVSEFSRQMKLLAKELDVPVVAVSQLNRGAEQRTNKTPMLSDLRESGSLEQDADLVILLHREDLYEKESTRPGEADIIVAKHRAGPTSTVVVAFQGHYSRFVDMQRV